MAGDVIYDGSGSPWRVERVAHAPGELPGDGAVVCWVEIVRDASGGRRTMRIPDARQHVTLAAGPGWGVDGEGDVAMTWAIQLAAKTLGGRVIR